MTNDFALRLYFQASANEWLYEEYDELPLPRSCVIVFHLNHDDAAAHANALIDGTRVLLRQLEAVLHDTRSGDWRQLDPGANTLHVLVCCGDYPAQLEAEILRDADDPDRRTWILPVFSIVAKDHVTAVLGAELRKAQRRFLGALNSGAAVDVARASRCHKPRPPCIRQLSQE